MSKKDLSSLAYEYIFDKIVTNEFPPGMPIVENDICNNLAISRTPVREALRRLEVEGLVYKIADRGTFVREINYDDIIEIIEIRKIFEQYALRNCVKNAPDYEIENLEIMMMNLDNESDADAYYNTDRTLHAIIMKYCQNRRMINYLDNLNAQIEKLRRVSASTPKRLNRSLTEHLEIIRAIKARDYSVAAAALENHMDNILSSVIEAYRQSKML
jgi:DNA-binding GntR family transcriptional regulator